MPETNVFTYRRAENLLDAEKAPFSLIDLRALLSVLTGFLASRATFLGGLSPLGLAWYSAFAPSDKYGYLLMSVVIGTLMSGGNVARLKYLAALGVFALVRRFWNTSLWERPWAAPAGGALALFLVGVTEQFFKGFLYFDFIIVLAESLAVFGAGMVFAKAVSATARGGGVIGDEEAISLTVLGAAAVAGMQGMSAGGIHLGNIAGVYIVLLAALKGGAGVSAAAGVAMGLIGGMAVGDIPALAGAYAFVGLAAGVARVFGKWGIIAGAILANAAFSLYYSGSSLVIFNVIEIAVATALFALTPNRFLLSIDRIIGIKKSFNPAEGYLLRHRRQTAEVLGDLCTALSSVSGLAQGMPCQKDKNAYRMGVLYERVAQKVCDECTLSEYCWTQNFDATYRLFGQTVEYTRQGMPPRDIAVALAGKCARTDRMIEMTGNMYELYKAENLCDSRADEYRGLAAAQLKKIAEVFEEQQQTFSAAFEPLPQKSGELERSLYRLGFDVRGVCLGRNRLGLYEGTIEVLGGGGNLAQTVGTLLDCDMQVVSTDSAGEGSIITLAENEKYEVEAFALCMDKDGAQSPGDSGMCFKSGGKYYCVLSDGMGSGEKAAKESGHVINLFKNLTLAGFEPETSIKILNSALILGSDSESCTTLDIACVHLQTSKIEIFKAGAAGTVIKGRDAAEVVQWASMPLGILDMDSFEKRYSNIDKPEFLIMFTDGVPENGGDRNDGEEFIRLSVEAYQDDSPEELCRAVMDAALSLGKPKDDMTVLVARISRKEN